MSTTATADAIDREAGISTIQLSGTEAVPRDLWVTLYESSKELVATVFIRRPPAHVPAMAAQAVSAVARARLSHGKYSFQLVVGNAAFDITQDEFHTLREELAPRGVPVVEGV